MPTERFSPADHTIPCSCRAHALFELFAVRKENAGKEAITIANYRLALNRFLAHPGVPDNPEHWTSDHLDFYLGDLARKKLAPATRDWHRRHLFPFIGFLAQRGVVSDFRKHVETITVPVERRRTATTDTVTKLLTAALAKGNPNPRRNAAIIHVLWSSGIRRTELAHVLLEDVNLAARTIFLRHTKKKNQRVVALNAAAREAIAEYIAEERGSQPGPLFLHWAEREENGRPSEAPRPGMTSDAIRTMLRRTAKRAKIPASSHDFRSGFAARVRAAGMDLGATMTLLGHKSPVMTLRYSAAGENDGAIAAFHAIEDAPKKKAK